MKINKLSPNFAVKNIKETVSFYEENFGFSLVMAVSENGFAPVVELDNNDTYVYAMVKKDDVEFMFQRIESFREDISLVECDNIKASVSFYMNVDGLDELYAKLKNKEVEVTDIKTTWYGMKEIYVKDVNGYILCFAQSVSYENK